MPFKFNPFTGNFDQTGSGGGSTVFDGEVQFFSDLPQTVGTPPVNSAYLVRESEGTIWFGNKKQKGIYIRSGNSGVRNDDWTYGGEYPVTSVNGQTGAITVAAVSHSHQPAAIYCDAVDVADTTLSSGEPNGIYFRDGEDNGKAIYKSAQGYSIWWDDGEEEWVLGNVPQTAKYYIGTGDTDYPWQATSWALGPQGSGDAPVVDQALLSNFQRNAAQDAVSARTPKTGNASSTQVVLGNDTRLSNSRTPTTHSAAHAATGSDPVFDQNLNTTDTPTFAGATINQSGNWGLTVDSGATETNTADFTGDSTNYNLIRVQNTDGGSSFYMACTGNGYSGSNFGESNAGQVSLEVNGGGTNKVGLIGNRYGPLGLGANDKIQLRLDSNGTTISDPTDITKKLRLSAASVAAGQTRVVTFPDKNITLDDAGDARTPTAHNHNASDINAGTLTHERGGLEADVSAYNGLLKISGGATSAVTVTATGESVIGAADAAAARSAISAAAGDDSRFHTRSHAMTGTSDHTASNWSVFYSNGSGQVTELALGAANTVLTSNGASSAPSFAAASGGGSTSIWLPASFWIPRTTTGCGVDSTELATNRVNTDQLLFDAATEEYAQAMVVMPSNYNNSTVTCRFYWSASSGSGAVVWALRGRAYADDDALDQAQGTGQTVTDTLLAANDMHVSPQTSAITLAGTPAANRPVQFELYRVAANASDTLGVDARLLGVEIIFN